MFTYLLSCREGATAVYLTAAHPFCRTVTAKCAAHPICRTVTAKCAAHPFCRTVPSVQPTRFAVQCQVCSPPVLPYSAKCADKDVASAVSFSLLVTALLLLLVHNVALLSFAFFSFFLPFFCLSVFNTSSFLSPSCSCHG